MILLCRNHMIGLLLLKEVCRCIYFLSRLPYPHHVLLALAWNESFLLEPEFGRLRGGSLDVRDEVDVDTRSVPSPPRCFAATSRNLISTVTRSSLLSAFVINRTKPATFPSTSARYPSESAVSSITRTSVANSANSCTAMSLAAVSCVAVARATGRRENPRLFSPNAWSVKTRAPMSHRSSMSCAF